MVTHCTIFTRGYWVWLLLLAACGTLGERDTAYHVILRVDEVERVYQFTGTQTVAALLEQAELTVVEGDHLSHALDTPLSEGLVVSLQRSNEWSECVRQPIPYGERRLPNELLAPGETRLGPVGKAGSEEVCTFIQIHYGETEQTEISRALIAAPRDQVVYYGSEHELADTPIHGTVAYLSHGSVWIMRGSSGARRHISRAADANGQVFALSPAGDQLLFTRQPDPVAANQLWLLPTTRELETPAILLSPGNVSSVIWHLQEPPSLFISHADDDPALLRYSLAAEKGLLQQVGTVHPQLAARPASQFTLSHSGEELAYAQPGELGIHSLSEGTARTLSRYAPQYSADNQPWLPPLSWSEADRILLTTLPAPTESQPDRYDIVAFFIEEEGRATLFADVGPRAIAHYSPRADRAIAFTRAEGKGYALYLADRDGSNARRLFPKTETAAIEAVSDVAWSASGQQILAIADGDLWLIEADSGRARQLTGDGGVSALEWAP